MNNLQGSVWNPGLRPRSGASSVLVQTDLTYNIVFLDIAATTLFIVKTKVTSLKNHTELPAKRMCWRVEEAPVLVGSKFLNNAQLLKLRHLLGRFTNGMSLIISYEYRNISVANKFVGIFELVLAASNDIRCFGILERWTAVLPD